MKKIAVGLILVGLAVVSMSSMFFHNRQTNKTYHAEEALQSIIIDDKNSPVTVVGTNDNRATIEYKESRNNNYRLKERDGVLTLERKDNWFFLLLGSALVTTKEKSLLKFRKISWKTWT